MGYMKHNAIIVVCWDSGRIEKAHKIASEIFKWVSPISPQMTNGYMSFFVPPDGSKEGWDESIDGDCRRQRFFSAISEKKDLFVDAIDVRFGGDDEISSVEQTTEGFWPEVY